eukprot:tig00021796_g23549.t1
MERRAKALGYNYGSYHGLNGVCYLGLFRKDDVKNPEPKPAPSFVPTPKCSSFKPSLRRDTRLGQPPQAFTNYPLRHRRHLPPSLPLSPSPSRPSAADDAKSEALTRV